MRCKGLFFNTGYKEGHYLTLTVLNCTLALLLLIIALPLTAILALVLKFSDGGGSIFYRGERLGLHKKRFTMYKFRTLPEGAEQVIGTEILSEKHRMVTPLTRFLRDTRLDELPQLINILKGDMDFIGPRPERPEVYEERCKNLRDYDKRFMVKPGLIGYAQLFTPHSTPKIIRTHIDNRLMLKKRSTLWVFYLVAYTIAVMHRDIFTKGRILLRHVINTIIFRSYTEKRHLYRYTPSNIIMHYKEENGDYKAIPEITFFDINDEYFRINCRANIFKENTQYSFKLIRTLKTNRKVKTKKSLCSGQIKQKHKLTDGYGFVVRYTPASRLNQYLLDKYFCNKSMA